MKARKTWKPLAQREWAMLSAIVRLAERFGCWPSRSELGREVGLHPDTCERILRALRDDGLATCIRRRGWMPTAEGLRWRGLSMPVLRADAAAPRAVRNAGIGAVRAWNRRQRLKTRVDAAKVLDLEPQEPPLFE